MAMINKLAAIALLLAFACYSEVPIQSAQRYLYVLVHGEDGKKSRESYSVFTTGDYPGGLKAYIENTYNVSGFVYAYQISDPSGPLVKWMREFGDMNNPDCWLNRARKDHKRFLTATQGITDEAQLEALTPKMFIVGGHSFGGIAVRSYLTSQYYTGNIKLFFTINSPHQGTDYPKILEVLETRTAVGRLTDAGIAALNSVEGTKKLVDAGNVVYDVGMACNSIAELVNELKSAKKRILKARSNIDAKIDDLRRKVPFDDAADLMRTFKEMQDVIKSAQRNVTEKSFSFDPASLGKIRTACDGLLNPSLPSASFSCYCKVIDGFKVSGFGNMQKAFSATPNSEMAAKLFSPEEFKAAFSPDVSLLQPGEISVYANAYMSAYILISNPSVVLSGNTPLFRTADRILGLRDKIASLSLPMASLKDIKVTGIDPEFFDDFTNNGLVKSYEAFINLKQTVSELENMNINAGTVIPACMDLYNAINGFLDTLACANDVDFYTKIQDLRNISIDLSSMRQAASQFLAQVNELKSYANLYEDVQAIARQSNLTVQVTMPGVEASMPGDPVFSLNAAIQFPTFIAKYAGKAEAQAYLRKKQEFISSYLKLLEIPSLPAPTIELPRVSLDASCAITIPDYCDALEKVFAIEECIAGSIESAKDIVDMYYDIKELKETIVELAAQLKQKETDESAETASEEEGTILDELGPADALSAILMTMSVLKTLGPAENSATSSAPFSVIAKKVLKKFLDNLWAEVQNGAILEVAFAEAATNATSVLPADATMTTMSNEGVTMDSLRNVLPGGEYADQLFHDTKYRVVYTSGVLTPNASGTKWLDLACGGGGSGSFIRGKIAEKTETLIDDMKNRLVDRIKSKINEKFNDLSEDVRKKLEDGLTPTGDFAKAVETAKMNGVYDQYKETIIATADEVLDEFNDTVQDVVDEVADKVGDAVTDALENMGDKLAQMEEVKKATAFLDKINIGLILSLYQTVTTLRGQGLGPGPAFFSLYYSPLLKLGLYENGDFVVTRESGKANDVLLYNKADDVKRFEYEVSDPLGPFVAIAALGVSLDIARLLAVDPGTKEGIRLAKLISITVLSLAAAVAKQDELTQYFAKGHSEAVSGIAVRSMGDQLFFDKPYVSIKMPVLCDTCETAK